MKFLTKISFLSLLAISCNTTLIKSAETLSTEFTLKLNGAMENLLQGKQTLPQVLQELEAALAQENHPSLHKEVGFLKQNYTAILLYKDKLIQLFENLKNHLSDNIRQQVEAMQLADWFRIVMRR